MHYPYVLIAAVLAFAGAVQYVSLQDVGQYKNETATETAENDARENTALITLESGMTREAIVEKIGTALNFDAETIGQFHDTYRSMQWDAYNDVLVPYLVLKYSLTGEDREILLTHSTVYLDQNEDILESLYILGSYTFSTKESVVGIVQKLLEPLESEKEALIPELLDEAAERALLGYVRNETELLPDLIPLPPLDVEIRYENGRTLLVFTTIYYNQGKGNLELRADPSTIGVPGDFDRTVYQRVYRPNNTYRERTAGTFEWHNEHLHYHFIDFIEYKLTAEEGTPAVGISDLAQKSTFCIRDVSRVYIDGTSSSTPADYRICGRERQGVSVGWGDAYFNTYVDQNLDITDLPSGEYTLSFFANPANRFDESNLENNYASARLRYSKEASTVEVLDTTPAVLPKFEHIHIDQQF